MALRRYEPLTRVPRTEGTAGESNLVDGLHRLGDPDKEVDLLGQGDIERRLLCGVS
jgi:hypothetical protein